VPAKWDDLVECPGNRGKLSDPSGDVFGGVICGVDGEQGIAADCELFGIERMPMLKPGVRAPQLAGRASCG
jgi:hypothetical protein